MLYQELQLLKEFCAAEVAVDVTVEDTESNISLRISSLSHRRHA